MGDFLLSWVRVKKNRTDDVEISNKCIAYDTLGIAGLSRKTVIQIWDWAPSGKIQPYSQYLINPVQVI